MGLCIVVVLGAGLRAYALDFQSLWADEICSLMITDPTLPFRQFWDRVLAETSRVLAENHVCQVVFGHVRGGA
jgi:hypothetical protein